MTKSITWQTEKRKLSDLLPWEQNPRQLSKVQAEHLEESLTKFGLVDPPAINTDNVIIGGHQRRNIMGLMKEYGNGAEIDVRVPSRTLTDREVEELNIRLNKNTGSFDFDALANNFEVDDLLDWGFEPFELGIEDETDDTDAEPQLDRAEELREKWGVELGQLWQLGEHRLICGDALNGSADKYLEEHQTSAIITDPPYAIFGSSTGVKGDVADVNMVRPFFRELGKFCSIQVKQRGHIYICCDWRSFPVLSEEIGQTVQIKNAIVWSKGESGYAGSFYSNTYELLAFFVNEPRTHSAFQSFNETGTPKHRHIYKSNVWHINRVPIKGREHFAEKPEELISEAIKNSTTKTDVVLDPFLGSGTTLIACENLGRKCYGVEIEPKYVAVTLQRYYDAFGIEPELIG